MLKTLQTKYIDPDMQVLMEEGVIDDSFSVKKPWILEAFLLDHFKKEIGAYVAGIRDREKKYKEDHAETRIVVNVEGMGKKAK
jgi:hypothetical protein